MSVISISSVAQSCPTLCHPLNHSTPGLLSITNSQSPPKPISIESVIPSSHLILSHPLLLLPSCPQSFPAPGSFRMSQLFTSAGQSIGVSASTSVLPMIIQDWFPLGSTDWLNLLAVQGTLKSLLQHHSSKASVLQCSPFFIVQLSHPYIMCFFLIISDPSANPHISSLWYVLDGTCLQYSCLENLMDGRAW